MERIFFYVWMFACWPFHFPPQTTSKSFGKPIQKRCALGLVAQWITRLTTDQKIPGSNPGELDF